MIRIKICGITRLADALTAGWAGADMIGYVFAPSPRRIDLREAGLISEKLDRLIPFLGRVGVFVDPSPTELVDAVETALVTHLQIHGRVPDSLPDEIPWIKALSLASEEDTRLPEEDPWAVLVEPKVEGLRGGTGQILPWRWVTPLIDKARVFVAGGLDAEAVASLLKSVHPFGVDASSALESSPGVKDPRKVTDFIAAVRSLEPKKGRRR